MQIEVEGLNWPIRRLRDKVVPRSKVEGPKWLFCVPPLFLIVVCFVPLSEWERTVSLPGSTKAFFRTVVPKRHKPHNKMTHTVYGSEQNDLSKLRVFQENVLSTGTRATKLRIEKSVAYVGSKDSSFEWRVQDWRWKLDNGLSSNFWYICKATIWNLV